MKLRNTLILLLCACMLIPLLAACKPENPDTITPESSSEEQTTPPEETTEEQAQDADAKEEAEETEEQENRSIDYSTYEARLAKLMK